MDYTIDIQKLFLQFLISEPTLYTRTRSILNPKYFHTSLQKTVKFIIEFTDKHGSVPKPEVIKSHTNYELEIIQNINHSEIQWFLQHIEEFCRHSALEEWIMKGMKYIEKKEYGELEKGLKDALLMSLEKNIGTLYFEDPKTRLLKLRENNGQIPTGWTDLDNLLYGGMNLGELNLFLGMSNAGKSLFLQNLALSWALAGKTVVYISLEMSEELCSMRIDSMITGFSTKEIFKRIEEVHDKVRIQSKKGGELCIKKLPDSGTDANLIKSFLKEFQIQTGKTPDILIVDYLDIMIPNNRKINPSDMFIKDKYVSEELRSLASGGLFDGHKMLVVSASQLNRTGVEETDYRYDNIAGGFSKIQTADNIFAIYTSSIMRERGLYQLQILKTRSSAGVNHKVELHFDVNSLRISNKIADDAADMKSIIDVSKFTKKPTKESSKDNTTVANPTKSAGQGRNIIDIISQMKSQ